MSKIIKSVLFEKNAVVVIKPKPMPVPVPEPVHELKPPVVVPEIDLEAVRAEAETIIANAQTAAAQFMAEAESKSQELAKEAYDEAYSKGCEDGLSQGFQEGFEQGNQTALAEMQQAMKQSLEKAESIIKTAEQEASQMIIEAEHQIIEIALAVVGRVLAREIEENPTTILPIVKEALAKVRDQDQIVIRVNPEDYEMVLLARRDLQLMVGRENAVSITPDHIISVGSCVIDTALGTVDARLDTKLELVYKAIREVLP